MKRQYGVKAGRKQSKGDHSNFLINHALTKKKKKEKNKYYFYSVQIQLLLFHYLVCLVNANSFMKTI